MIGPGVYMPAESQSPKSQGHSGGRCDGNRIRQVNLHFPLQEIDTSMNAYYFAF